MTIDERTRKHLTAIVETINGRKDTFGKALIGVALTKNDRNDWKVCYCLINFLRRGEAPVTKTRYNYGSFLLFKTGLEVAEAIDSINSIWEQNVLKFDDFPDIPLKASLSETRFIQSHGRYGPISCQWPLLYTYGRIDDNTRGKIPQNPLSRPELPLFPSGLEAINVFLQLNLPEDFYHVENNVDIRIPDYRAKIRNLRLAGERVSLEVETGELTKKDLIVKFYCRSKNKIYTSRDLPLQEGRATYSIDEEPFVVEAHLLSTLNGESIDRRKFDYRYPSGDEGVVIEEIEAQLLDVIGKGETVSVEFKKELDKRRVRFLETVVAFANTKGGTIFLGVDDNCQIRGFKEDVETKIVDLIAEHCDPPIDVQISPDILVHGLPITLVKVPEGKNKPYTLKDRGIFVRRGASNRQIKRTELDDIYDRKQSDTPYHM